MTSLSGLNDVQEPATVQTLSVADYALLWPIPFCRVLWPSQSCRVQVIPWIKSLTSAAQRCGILALEGRNMAEAGEVQA